MGVLFDYLSFLWGLVVYIGVPAVFWVRPRWSATQIPNQTGKVVIVTGGNSGIGYETCKALYEAGATVYLACRDLERGRKAIESIKRGGSYNIAGMMYPVQPPPVKSGGRLECLRLDLADLDSVDDFVTAFRSRETRLDVLFANAGVMATAQGYTKQGYTLQFGTNCLGHQRLISSLLPTLLQTARNGSLPRVISCSSAAHACAPIQGIDYASLKRDGKGQNKWLQYGQSKWGNAAFARWLHWAYGPAQGRKKKAVTLPNEDGGEIAAFAIHPGCIATNLAQHLSLTNTLIARKLAVLNPVQGASNQLWLATCTDDEARKLSGEYIVPFQRVGSARPDLDNTKKVNELWQWCEAQSKKR